MITGIVIAMSGGCAMPYSMRGPYDKQVQEEFLKQPLVTEDILRESDIARLPRSVQRYLRYTRSVGKPKIQNFRLEFDIEMKKKPDARPMVGTTEQFNFMGEMARLFYMKVHLYGIPADGLHSYRDKKATMRIRVASLFNAVDTSGAVLDETETVTVLNDICLMAPAALIDPRFSFQEIDDSRVGVTFVNGAHKVSAVLYFGKDGELVDFSSEDRSALQDDGSFKKLRFSTPVGDYKEFEGRLVLTRGQAVFHYPEGPFAYGKLRVRDIRYNVRESLK
jgi:hypothetical protein